MIVHKTFSTRHFINMVGGAAIKHLEEMRQEAERFIETKIGEDSVIAISETSDDEGNRIFKIAGQAVHYQQDDDTDCQMAEDGYITITPMHTDTSDFEAIVKMSPETTFAR